MRSLLFLLTACAVIASGFWAYRENYTTQAELDRVETLRRDIGEARERLAILRAEWAYLNRPDRLRDLAELNFDRLGLLPLLPEQFGNVDQVVYPQPEEIEFTQPVDVSTAEMKP
ncbi:cell division protein FtsL [Thetidibacter halocola]|uniref:Cell division protein FtsL n=1 Tax=Thetidibacter halocola TaxID=2827239 RepID=A0A8J7WDN2_9RHOB|nr:cell division protein FtsL [Thetidibacter halocola]MBS0123208.1 cell division protein FtsL [Thetidibacter halocola]